MKQVVQHPNGDTRVSDVPVPAPGRGSVVVATEASLVSVGTERMIVEFARKGLLSKARARPDLVRQVVRKVKTEGLLTTVDAVRRRLDQPMPLGYSCAGRILSVGAGIDGLTVGDRVACAGAGHAEVVRVPRNLVTRVPDGVSAEAASFTTVGAIALHGFRLAGAGLGEKVVVIGLGLIGLLTVQICRAAGIRVLGIDPDPVRRDLALALGADVAVGTDQDAPEDAVAAWTDGWGADAALVAASSEGSGPLLTAAAVTRDRGTVVAVGAFGMDVPRRPFYMKELQLRVSRSYGPGRYDPAYEDGGVDYPIGYVRWTEGRNLEAVVGLMASGDLTPDRLVTHRFPIEEAETAYKLITGGDEPTLGVLLTYDAEARVAAGHSGRTVVLETGRGPGAVDVEGAPRTRDEDAKVGLGLVGAGQFATGVLMPAIRQSGAFEPVGVCSSGGMSGKHAGDRFGFGYATSDLAELLGDDAVELMAIATRHGAHAEQVVRSIEAGKHVFVEKPLCLTEEQLADVVRSLSKHPEAHLMVGFNRRFAPLAGRLRQFVEEAGEPALLTYRVNAGALPRDHWVNDPEAGGGRILGEVCHFIDFSSYVVGALPTRVSTTGVRDGGRYQDDNVHVSLEFEDGSAAGIAYAASGDRVVGKERCEVFAGGGTAILDDFRTLHIARGGRLNRHRSRLRQDKGHGAEWVALAEGLRTGVPALDRASIVGSTLATLRAARALREGGSIEIDVHDFVKASTGAGT